MKRVGGSSNTAAGRRGAGAAGGEAARFRNAALFLLVQSCGAFVGPSSPTARAQPSALWQTESASGVAEAESSPASDVPARPKYACYSAAQIAEAQAEAEARARSFPDPFAVNALCVNVEERPEPTACSIAPDSPSPTLPSDLPRGCYLRIGPNGASTKDGWLDGDGMVNAITIPPDGRGEMMYSRTYVDTRGRKVEREAGNGKTFEGTLGAAPWGLPVLANLIRNGLAFGTLDVQKDTCNTALAVSGKRVLALMEQSPPSEIAIDRSGRVRTVESFARLGGAVPISPITGGELGAHGRTDPLTGERVHVSYRSTSRPYVRVDTFSDNWELGRSVGVDVPTPVMVHDLALTEKYAVILDFPLTIRPRRMFLSNLFPVQYEPQNGARIGLTPRGKDKDETMWFDVENGVVLHAANAYERDDGTVVVHAFKSVPEGSSSYILDYTPAFLYEWVLDPSTGNTVAERCLNPDVLVEFPATVETATRAPAAYGLVTTSIVEPLVQFKTPDSAVLLDGVVKFALEDDAFPGFAAGDVLGRYDLPSGWHMVSEPTIVEKTSGKGHYVLVMATFVPPADGYDYERGDHVTVAADGESMWTQLLVLDGDDVSGGPVTKVDLPYHVNYGMHSEFVDWDLLEGLPEGYL